MKFAALVFILVMIPIGALFVWDALGWHGILPAVLIATLIVVLGRAAARTFWETGA